MKVQAVIQMQLADNASATLCTMLAYYKRYVPMEEVRPICPGSRSGTPPTLLAEAAAAYGFDTEIREADIDELKAMAMPIVVLWKRRHYVVVKGFRRGLVEVSDPAKGEYEITEEKFAKTYSGTVVAMKPSPDFKRGGQPEKLSEMLSRRLGDLKTELVKLFVLNLIAVLLNMAFVEGIRRILNEHTFDGMPWFAVWVAIGIESLILLLYTSFAMRKTLLVNDASRKAAARSGARMFKHLFRMPIEFFDRASAGELMQRFNNNSTLDRSIMLTTIPRIIDAVTVVAYLVLMFSYNVYVAMACLIVEVVFLVAMRAQRNALAIRSRSMVTSAGAMNAAVLNGMGMIETLKVSGTERVFFGMWCQSQEEFQQSSIAGLRVNAITQVISGVHSLFSSAVLLFVGAHFMIQGSFDAAAMAAMQIVVSHVGSSLSNCVNSLNALQTMRTNIERVEDLYRRPIVPEIPLKDGSFSEKLSGEVEVSHVSYRYYPGDPLAVSNVSFKMEDGQVFAIVGKTGCGKSTLLKLIADLYRPTSGEITYGGMRREDVPDVAFRSSVVTVDQEAMMFEDSVRSNLKMWDETIEDYAMVLAARDAQIHDRIISEQDGYDTLIRESGKNYSGGELQRLELARALETEPTLLLLDEFTSALDTLTENKVMQAIRGLGITCIIVAHRLSTIRDADQILVMDKGSIVARGTHDELMAAGGLYKELVATG